MKRFVIYNNEGKILRTGSCPDDMFDIQRGDNELIVEGTANDATQHVVDGVILDKPDLTTAEQTAIGMLEIRQIRDLILADTDWTQLPDSPLAEGKKIEWQEYREKLRNLPSENEDILDIDDVSFPAPPA